MRCAWSVGLLGVALVTNACAVAGNSGGGHEDASTHTDGPRAIDAHSSDATAVNTCASTVTCQTAKALMGVSGDTGEDMVSDTGYQSAWDRVRVTENDSGTFGVPQAISVTLTSPSTASYGLFVYVNTGSDVLECMTPNGTPTTSGTTQTLQVTWGETGTFSNGDDDSRNVSIEVRPLSGSCSAAQPWQLSVTGDV